MRTLYGPTLIVPAAGNPSRSGVFVFCFEAGGSAVATTSEQAWFPKARLCLQTHNYSEMADANSLAPVEAGATMVQGTINGYGERTGNANLCSIIAALALKMGAKLFCGPHLPKLRSLSLLVDEIGKVDSRVADSLIEIERLSFQLENQTIGGTKAVSIPDRLFNLGGQLRPCLERPADLLPRRRCRAGNRPSHNPTTKAPGTHLISPDLQLAQPVEHATRFPASSQWATHESRHLRHPVTAR
jgi:hypothetical protein